MSTIAAGTTSTTALVQTADTTGNLIFQTNGTTQALQLNTSGAVGVGSSASYGTTGQALISQGSGAAPIWGSAGAFNLISVTTITGAPTSVTISSGISSTYTKYKLVIESLYDSAQATAFVPRLNFYAGGSVDTNAVYNTNGSYVSGGTGPTNFNGSGAAFISPASSFGGGGTIANSYFMYLEFSTILNTSGNFRIKGTGTASFGTTVYFNYGFNYNGSGGNNAAVTGIYLTTSAGVGLVGTISLYGMS